MSKRKKTIPPILFMYAGAVACMGAMVFYRISSEAPGVLSGLMQ